MLVAGEYGHATPFLCYTRACVHSSICAPGRSTCPALAQMELCVRTRAQLLLAQNPPLPLPPQAGKVGDRWSKQH